MEKRICKLCALEFDVDSFPCAGVKKNGDAYRRWACANCYYVTNNKKNINRAKAWFIELKKGLQCLDCGKRDHRVLDFHHRDPSDKAFSIADRATRGWSIGVIMKEIEKCDVLCANCHRIREFEKKTSKGA